MNGIHEVRGSIPLSSTIKFQALVKGVCEAMRLTKLKSLVYAVAIIATTVGVAGCENPFDPLKSSSKIQGLTYFDFAATQEHWDTDPSWDGIQISLSYYNEFSTTITFHDKTHNVLIEFYKEEVTDPGPPEVIKRTFLTSKTVAFSNSDDFIRIPIEYYGGLLGIDPDTPEDIKGCLQVRIYPPQEYPKRELVAPFQCGVDFFKKETVEAPL